MFVKSSDSPWIQGCPNSKPKPSRAGRMASGCPWALEDFTIKTWWFDMILPPNINKNGHLTDRSSETSVHEWIQKSPVSFLCESIWVNIQNWPRPRGKLRAKHLHHPGVSLWLCGSGQVTLMIEVIQHVQESLSADGTDACDTSESDSLQGQQRLVPLSWRQWVYYHPPGPKAFHQVWTFECRELIWSGTHGGPHWTWCHMRTVVQGRFDSKHASTKRWSKNSGLKIFELSIQQLSMTVRWNCPRAVTKPSEPTWWHGELVEKP